MRRFLSRLTSLAALTITVGCAGPAAGPAADLIVTNAHIWTVDAVHPRAEAVAVIGERIVAVGAAPEIDAWRGPATRIIDAAGRLVLPGFNDAHIHLVQAGLQLDSLDLKDADTPEEFSRRIGEWAPTGTARRATRC